MENLPVANSVLFPVTSLTAPPSTGGSVEFPFDVKTDNESAFTVRRSSDGKVILVVDTTGASLAIHGDLSVYGTTTFVDAPLSISDNLIALGSGNTTNDFDLGIYGVLNDGVAKYAGIYYDHSSGRFKAAYSLVEPAPNMVSAVLMDFQVAGLYSSTLTGTLQTASQPNVTSLAGLLSINTSLNGILSCSSGVLSGGTATTDMLTEGVVNLYYANSRARGAISGSNGISYNSGTGVISLNATYAATFASMILSNLTGLRLVSSSSGGQLISTVLASWINGTTNQVIVADAGSGAVTLSLPQSIGTGSSPTFTGLTLSGVTPSSILNVGAGGSVGAVGIGASLSYAAGGLNTIQDIRTSASPTFAGLTLSGLTTSRILAISALGAISVVTVSSNLQYTGGTLDTIQGIGTTATPTFAGLTLSGLTASALVYLNGSKAAASVVLGSNLTLTSGTLDTVQAIGTGSSPTFLGVTLNGSTSGYTKLTTAASSGSNLLVFPAAAPSASNVLSVASVVTGTPNTINLQWSAPSGGSSAPQQYGQAYLKRYLRNTGPNSGWVRLDAFSSGGTDSLVLDGATSEFKLHSTGGGLQFTGAAAVVEISYNINSNGVSSRFTVAIGAGTPTPTEAYNAGSGTYGSIRLTANRNDDGAGQCYHASRFIATLATNNAILLYGSTLASNVQDAVSGNICARVLWYT